MVKAAAEAMAAAPAINGRWEKDQIAVSPTIDIGVGTAPRREGAGRPGREDAGKLSLEQIGAKLDELTRRAREGKLDRSGVSGGSFTISNHGVSGSLLAAPIILHQGQAAILGIGKLEKRVIVREIGGEDAIPRSPDGLCNPHHRPPGRRRSSDQCVVDAVRRDAGELARGLGVGLVRRHVVRELSPLPPASQRARYRHRSRSSKATPSSSPDQRRHRSFDAAASPRCKAAG